MANTTSSFFLRIRKRTAEKRLAWQEQPALWLVGWLAAYPVMHVRTYIGSDDTMHEFNP